VPFPPGALLRIGESSLRLSPPRPATAPPLSTTADNDGHLRVWPRGSEPAPAGGAPDSPWQPASTAPIAPDLPAQRGPTAAESYPRDRGEEAEWAGGPGSAEAEPYAYGTGPDTTDASAETYGHGIAAPGDGVAGSGRRATGEQPRRALGEPEARGGVVGAIGAWARRLAVGRPAAGSSGHGGAGPEEDGGAEAEALRERWPDPAAVLLTALGPGRRLWERGHGHPDALTVRLGTAALPSADGSRVLPAVPYTVDLRVPATAALTLTGPRPRLSGLARAVLAQLCALHSPATLEVVLLSADRTRGADERTEEWSWLNWVPHLRPAHGQDCRLLLAFDRDQAEARAAELVRRLEAGPLGPGWAAASQASVAAAAAAHEGPFTLLVVDGDPGSAGLREVVARIAATGPSAGIHVLCLADPGEPPAIRHGAVAEVCGDVATTLRVGPADPAAADAAAFTPLPHGEIVLDAVSAAWAEHFARALAPLREADAGSVDVVSRHALPGTVRLLDELDLALATPARIASRWGEAAGARAGAAGATAVLGLGAAGRVAVDLVAEGPHAMVGGAPGSGKTELLRSLAAALAAAERPDRLALVLVDGAGLERGEGLAACADLPHVSTHLVASDPVRMREFAQALSAELKRRAQVLGEEDFATWHARRSAATVPHQGGVRTALPALPRLVVVVDDFDALVAPGLGSTGRPAAGSVVRALEAVAREGERLGVHLFASTGRPERTAGTDADERARLRIALRMPDPESAALLVHVEDPAGLDDALPGRGYLRRPGGAVTVFQTARVSARIPRTATLRPTVVPLEWERMGDPPARRQVRELGNGPTDLALLASALQRAAETAPEEAGGPERAAVRGEDAAAAAGALGRPLI
jgi:hypothetical protein